jgi:hypothetical protein
VDELVHGPTPATAERPVLRLDKRVQISPAVKTEPLLYSLSPRLQLSLIRSLELTGNERLDLVRDL